MVAGEGEDLQASEPVAVLDREDHPEAAFFEDQELVEGINYIEMRDGTTLAAMVRFPRFPRDDVPGRRPVPDGDQHVGLRPGQPLLLAPRAPAGRCPRLRDGRGQPAGQGLFGRVALVLRGSEIADGYDVVEAIAAQDWVAHDHVGMVGISYPGITQLFVASTQPPHLAAIAPDVGDRRGLRRRRLPGRHLQQRLRRRVDHAASARRRGLRRGLRQPADRRGRRDLRRQPGPALPEPGPGRRAGGRAVLRRGASRARSARPAWSTASTSRCSSPASGRTSRPAATSPTCSTDFTGTDRLHVRLTNGPHGDGLTLPSLQRVDRVPRPLRGRADPRDPGGRPAGCPRRHRRHLRRRRRPRARTASPATTPTRRRWPTSRPTTPSP